MPSRAELLQAGSLRYTSDGEESNLHRLLIRQSCSPLQHRPYEFPVVRAFPIGPRGIEPRFPGSKPSVLPLDDEPLIIRNDVPTLPGRDSNPAFLLQRQASYRWTTRQFRMSNLRISNVELLSMFIRHSTFLNRHSDAPGGARTHTSPLKRRVLCRSSYGRLPNFEFRVSNVE